MQTNHTSEFPKTLEELAALDAAREIPFLAFQCALHGIQIQNPTPVEALRAAENHLHNHRGRRLCDYPGGQQAWASVCKDLEKFIDHLRPLASASDTRPGTQGGTRNGTPSEHPSTTSKAPTSSLMDEIQQFLADFDPEGKVKKRSHNADPENSSHSNSAGPNPSSNPNPQSFEELSALCQEISDQLQKKSSALDDLPPEKQQTLFQLIQDHPFTAVQKVIALPSPQGWGMKISRGSLQRFEARFEKRRIRQQQREAIQLTRELLADTEASDADLLAASKRLATIRLVQLANDPHANIRELKDLFQIQTRLKSLDLAQQRIDIQKEKANRAEQDRGSREARHVSRDNESLTNEPSSNQPHPITQQPSEQSSNKFR